MNRMRGDSKGSREDGSAVGVGGHSNGFTGSGDVDNGQDTKVELLQIAFSSLMTPLTQMGGLASKFKMSPGRGAPLVSN